MITRKRRKGSIPPRFELWVIDEQVRPPAGVESPNSGEVYRLSACSEQTYLSSACMSLPCGLVFFSFGKSRIKVRNLHHIKS
ncbi:hypothetical protein L6452_14911 [Arctium lappa]|uniref:Uncharacterized protein n=1 Tax=Arctium lappa TaxID=4217 RepID=A0ACB9CMA5_ARCLA|nr:hypothetical protein L6452_14911 [Arctium lappa]